MKRIMQVMKLYLVIITLFSCSKKDSTVPQGSSKPADIISGNYSGSAKFQDGPLDLPSTTTCTKPIGWDKYIKSGSGSLKISKVNDSTATIILTGGIFPNDSYNVKTISSGSNINLNMGIYTIGSYYVTDKLLVFGNTAPNFSYATAGGCNIGLPYFSTIYFPSINPNDYEHKTIKRYEFNGYKL